jgi:feruloyl-CoA synthase
MSVSDVLAHECVRRAFADALAGLAAKSTGSSTFVARAVLLDQPPSIDAREVTDKGSINQKAVLLHRSAIVDELYAEPRTARVLVARTRT